MLKDYSALMGRLLYTDTDPIASWRRSLAYKPKLISWAFFIQTCWQCEAATHAGLNIVLHCRLFLFVKNWTIVSLTPILQVFIFIPNTTSAPGCWFKDNACTRVFLIVLINCLWCQNWKDPVSFQGTFLVWKWLHVHSTATQIFRQTSHAHEVFFFFLPWNSFGLYTDLTLKSHNFDRFSYPQILINL